MSMMVKSVAVEKQSQLECPKLPCSTYTLLLVKKNNNNTRTNKTKHKIQSLFNCQNRRFR